MKTNNPFMEPISFSLCMCSPRGDEIWLKNDDQ